MRELTVQIRFTSACLGDMKLDDGSGRFIFQRGPSGHVLFLASWLSANMRLAAQLLSRFYDEVGKIHWDINVDGIVRQDPWFKAYYKSPRSNRWRFSVHEAFHPGDVVAINCVVPATISDDDFWRLMAKAGQYKGISPYKPGEYGFYEVVTIRPRNVPQEDEEIEHSSLAEETRQEVK